jgi:2-oxoglutarate-Fe(II)-dependent oxygenase superfamily protein
LSRANIPAFDDFLDGESKTRPFSNNLTLTNDDFSNFLHRDKDYIAAAFGMWWTSAKSLDHQPDYTFTDDLDHKQIDGGGFLWGEYKIGIDFQR